MNGVWKNRILFLFLFFLSLCTMGAKRPNVVIISASNLGYSDLGCYGGEIHTPAIDKLAAEGMQFTQFYSCGNSAMTQTALMTGQDPHRVGMGFPMADLGWKGYRGSISKSSVTLAEFLKSVGYNTFMAGKWGLTMHYKTEAPSFAWPTERGFDQYFGTILSQTSYFEPQELLKNKQPYSTNGKYYHTYATAKEAVNFLEIASTKEKPFFLYAAFTAPSWPLQAPEEEIRQYARTYSYGWDAIRTQRFSELQKLGLFSQSYKLPPRDERVSDWNRVGAYQRWQSRRMEVYAAQVSAMDRGVAMIMEKIKQIGAEENTIVIFLSDAGACGDELSTKTKSRSIPEKTKGGEPTQIGNNPNAVPGSLVTFQSYGVPWANVSNTPLRGYADTVYEGGITSPCIVHWVNHTEPGIVKEPVHILDVFPTIVELSERVYPKELNGYNTQPLQGKSFTPLFSVKYRMDLLTDTEQKGRFFCWECKGNIAVRHGQWKLVFPKNGHQWELYNMLFDRVESMNIFAQNQQKPEILQMIAYYEKWKNANRVQNWDEVQARLRSPKKK